MQTSVSNNEQCFAMKEYDLIVIGTGSGMEVATAAIQENPDLKVAVIDKDDDANARTAATAAATNSHFAGGVDAVSEFARSAWKKISGGCHATASPGNVRIVACRMASVTSEDPMNYGGAACEVILSNMPI